MTDKSSPQGTVRDPGAGLPSDAEVTELVRELRGIAGDIHLNNPRRQEAATLDKMPEWQAASTIEYQQAENRRLAKSLADDGALLRKWASISKGLSLHKRNGEVADYDDELASDLAETALAILRWRDGPDSWQDAARQRSAKENASE